ncbi:recombination-related endonuclease [Acidovorax phage ACP17]|uniref:Recombination-related endonuclease n=1 Tax=Acidovorax phage ACP17 TaxID=2010329 RepID=A0A218M2W5_9CAUD|nr:recombination-related endonuclease [Acidovorax phage ACP17]ASD50387.1 recombination-related endonuclease [Acidovorax phage ACP17]
MIRFTRLRWRNLFSYGNTWTDIQLDRSPSTIILGKNGGGKSAFFEALHINLFGQSIRPLKKQQWVNNKNAKGLETESYFMDGEDEIVIRRCVKPDEFTITRNGQPLNQEASVREMQNIINRDILGSDKVGFQITTLISKSGIQMFMSLKAEERRRFIDNMLGTGVFTEMAKLQKVENDKLKQLIEATTTKVTRSTALVEGKRSEIATAVQMQADAAAQRQREHEARLQNRHAGVKSAQEALEKARAVSDYDQDEKEDVLRAQKKLDELDPSVTVPELLIEELRACEFRLDGADDTFIEVDAEEHQRLKKKRDELNSIVLKMEAKKLSLEGSLDSLKAGYCQACRQDVGEDHIKAERAKLAPKVMEIEGMLDDARKKIEGFETKIRVNEESMRNNDLAAREAKQAQRDIDRAKQAIEDFRGRQEIALKSAQQALEGAEKRLAQAGTRHQKRLEELEEAVRKAEEQLETERDFDPSSGSSASAQRIATAEAELGTLEQELAKVMEERNEQAVRAEYMAVMTSMLKDGGIKAVVVKKFMPIVNRLVNEKLAELGFFAKFEMDENFEERILYNGVQEMTFHQFSEGEKLRINLALILAWREIARLQGRMHSNLLMFDECLDGSLDDDGYESLTEIFKVLGNLNVFIISHNPNKMENIVRTKMIMEKTNGFSRLADTVVS